jgi:hypothetical protein
MGNIVDDILSRLFYSSLQVSRLDEAYAAVLQMEDHALYVTQDEHPGWTSSANFRTVRNEPFGISWLSCARRATLKI